MKFLRNNPLLRKVPLEGSWGWGLGIRAITREKISDSYNPQFKPTDNKLLS